MLAFAAVLRLITTGKIPLLIAVGIDNGSEPSLVRVIERCCGHPRVSAFNRDFNFDFTASINEEQQREGVDYNCRREAAWQRARSIGEWRGSEGPVGTMASMTGTDEATYTRERPGMSAFAREEGILYHTYSTYARGIDPLWGMYQWLDRAPKGRNETGVWWRRHDEYDKG